MSDRADDYANQFQELSRQFIATIEGYTPEQMQARCVGEQCTVAALASHIAGVHNLVADWVVKSANGEPLPELTMDTVNAINADQFARDANRPKSEIIASLRENGAAAAEVVRNLDDAQLDRSSYFTLFGRDVTTDWLVQNILIGDIANHSASIRAACGEAATA